MDDSCIQLYSIGPSTLLDAKPRPFTLTEHGVRLDPLYASSTPLDAQSYTHAIRMLYACYTHAIRRLKILYAKLDASKPGPGREGSRRNAKSAFHRHGGDRSTAQTSTTRDSRQRHPTATRHTAPTRLASSVLSLMYTTTLLHKRRNHMYTPQTRVGTRVVRRRRLRRTQSGAASVGRRLRARRRTSLELGHMSAMHANKPAPNCLRASPPTSRSRHAAADAQTTHRSITGGCAGPLFANWRLPRPPISRSSTIRHVEGGFSCECRR